MNWIEQRDTPCKQCGATAWTVECVANRGGQETHPLVCGACGYKTCVYVPKSIMKQHALVVGVNLSYKRHQEAKACEVCGEIGAELHHWAPFYAFGGEAERWPKGYLCQACHARWHDVIRKSAEVTA